MVLAAITGDGLFKGAAKTRTNVLEDVLLFLSTDEDNTSSGNLTRRLMHAITPLFKRVSHDPLFWNSLATIILSLCDDTFVYLNYVPVPCKLEDAWRVLNMADNEDKWMKNEKFRQLPEGVRTLASFFEDREDVYLYSTFWEKQDEINAFEVKPGDVWILSFPKSGTTWVQEMAWLLTHNLDFEGAKSLLKYRSPGIESCWSKARFGLPGGMTLNDFERLASMSGGWRVLKTHLPWKVLPAKLRDPNCSAKMVYVARNPKDVCVSFFYFHKFHPEVQKLKINLDDFCQNFMYGKYNSGPYWSHVKEVWSRRNNKNILFVKYEDMKKDLEKVVCEVATFLEVPIPAGDQMKKLLDHLSFENMKSNPALNRQKGEGQLKIEGDLNGDFIRKGTVGDWKEKMTPERVKEFDEWIKTNLQDTDLSFEDFL